MSKPMKVDYVPRVTQLDAHQFDAEIKRLFKNQLSAVALQISPGFLSKFEPELDLILNSLLWNYSIKKSNAIFGQQLFSIQYDDVALSKNKLLLHYVATILLKYVKSRLQYDFSSNEFIQNIITNIETVISVINLLNFWRFLKTGISPHPIEYILGLRHISMVGNKIRTIGYSHMTRELIWAAFVELLMVVAPFINYYNIRRQLLKLIPFAKKAKTVSNRKISYDVKTLCPICKERIKHPHHMGCSHVFCYFCLQSNLMADSMFQCSLCDHNGPIQRVIMS